MPKLTEKLVLKIITNNIRNAANVNIYPDAIFENDEIDYSSCLICIVNYSLVLLIRVKGGSKTMNHPRKFHSTIKNQFFLYTDLNSRCSLIYGPL